MNFSQKLIQLRKAHHLTQAQLAEKLHLSRQAISKWETGDSQPDLDTLTALCDIFQVSTDELLRDTPPTPTPAAIGLKQILLLLLAFCASMLILGCLVLIILNIFGPNFGLATVLCLFFLQLGLSSTVVYQVYKRLRR